MKKLALLSVYDKTGIVEFAKKLEARNFQVISTGGTLKKLLDNGVKAIAVEDITNFQEMLDGRVKTLHPRIHAGILAKRDNPVHMKQLSAENIQPIDLVCVNLYPFKATIEKPGVTDDEAIENIDIGGPSMLRAAAKNSQDVIVLTDFNDYDDYIERYDDNKLDSKYHRHLAAKVFRQTAAYDALIAKYLTNEEFPDKLTLTYEKVENMRYGENSHQQAAYYKQAIPEKYSLANAKQLHGKALSYNNIRDADAALRVIAEFPNQPTVVALKHMNPCGIGTANNLLDAWQEAFDADPISIFGGIIVLNREVDLATAQKMHSIFLEIVIAPSFTDEAYDVLAKKKNIRLITLSFGSIDQNGHDEVSVLGGILVQNRDLLHEEPSNFKVVSKVNPTADQLKALAFGQNVVKHVKSNAIVVTTDTKTLGVGAGQMNRIDSTKIAIDKAQPKAGYDKAILASDAFFPMDDCVEFAAKHGIKAIVEPGGSIKDQASIDKANELGIALVFSGKRHFKH
ncbi:bifunctional phosphoribosylaminoimidazolecarboxamide formyltransferase/IMP cyclohydrolase PurH [Apilactobacillus timberlakei]|uniref:bifunctional phosphoribosylaminoimidazolecarboxamide formyltransferase/IMP cyclohydrolase n=1 Tax=Apilactobacillus timberlakei TaxID=2008380 RepID=UPI00112C62A3|nr:bifunctional phosphoribosylaminoimidazolecarboxamide formyltransferase/IMP cyclohydrolase [Apilactobacillus timberlakei]TPR20125.1 bifunctional phosphoribosylaminoimidazolecarboxamide formyltransferase/IMP cyclohydrolase PurH [Apilactobacillus timberlakei]TPR20438.1 bifunctional phosphoribosylaminoimidazolecarboxamide formyltransferase/IMP cyclohydrolase PurH [Apilactobacillus timberlakei]TPR21843.1 bifunctional phosphoribosylaminoimidazolecarboxamide formyltransferase/IMP cyclohydrolase PurH